MKKQNPRALREDSQLYHLASHPTYYFEVGRSVAGQALWGFLNNAEYVLHFDLSGELQRVERRGDLSKGLRGRLGGALQAMSLRIRAELELDSEVISIHRFWLADIGAGIEDLSEDLTEFIDDHDSFDEEEQSELQSALKEWLSDGMFVFWWEQSFEMNSEGEVVTS